MKLIITTNDAGISAEGADLEFLGDMLSLPEWVILSIAAWVADDGVGEYVVHAGDGLVVRADNGVVLTGIPEPSEEERIRQHKLERCSDFHKDVWGYRPVLTNLYESEVVAIYDACNAELDRLKSTKAGRAKLLREGWSL